MTIFYIGIIIIGKNNNSIESISLIVCEKGGFLITWLPYSMGSMYVAFIDANGLTPMLETLPAMFAKSSMVWSTIFFIFSNKQFKSKIGVQLFVNMDKLANSPVENNSATQTEIVLTPQKAYGTKQLN